MPDIIERHGLPNVEEDPAPTRDGYEWRCNCCQFRTERLAGAALHVRNLDGSCLSPMLFERPPSSEEPWSKAATRRMVYHEGDVIVQLRKRRRG